jgi:hypothetical protein
MDRACSTNGKDCKWKEQEVGDWIILKWILYL